MALMFLSIIFGLIFLIGAIAAKNEQASIPKRVTPTVNQNKTVSSRVSKISQADINRIDEKLEKYFKQNVSLPVIESISLTTQSGKFTTVDQLYLTYKDEKIIKLEEFKEKHIGVYERILELLLVFYNKSDEVLKAEVEIKPATNKKLSTSDKYIDKINDLNEAIPQEEITNGLYQTCDLLKKIDVLTQSKSDEAKAKKLYDYYLPILINVLEKYKSLQDNSNQSEEFKKCEAQLIKTIILINEALKTICDNMQEDDYMNINADINTLQSLLQKDGYGDNPFSGE